MENHQNSPFDRPSQVFRGIRFVLLGFDPINKAQVSRRLVNGGGIDAGVYGPNCTHVIVNKLVYDDPLCVAARRDGKILVSGLWADHSFDVGVPVDPTSVMYRPVRDLNGIPGGKSLVICLTGYQREDREDIMTMVDLMGAQFSKPLIANKVTHLICYKFEGEKYLLAKKMKRIKLINHRWLEDCLKAWEIVSEADYTRSGYELEMEAEAKDSEDEAEGVVTGLTEVKKESPYHSMMLKQDASTSLQNTSASKGFENANDNVSVTMKTTSDQFLNPNKNVVGLTCEPSNLFKGTTSSSAFKKSPSNESRNVMSSIYSRKVPMGTTPPTTDTSDMNSAKRLEKINLSDAFNMSSPFVEKEEQNESSFGKRKMEISSGSSKLQKTSHNEDTLNKESLHMESVFQEKEKNPSTEMSNHVPLGTGIPYVSEKKVLSSKGKSVTCDEISTPPVQDKGFDEELKEASVASMFGSRDIDMLIQSEFEIPEAQKPEHVMQSLEKSSPSAATCDIEKSSTPNLEINEQSAGSGSKSVKRKSIAKKFSAPKQNLGKKKTVDQKGSIYLQNIEPQNDRVDVQGVGDDKNQSNEKVEDASEIEKEKMDDETESPEDKEEHGPHTADVVMEENEHGDDVNQSNEKVEVASEAGNSVSVNVDKSKALREKKLPSTKKSKKKPAVSVKDASDKKEAEIREEGTPTPLRASKRSKRNVNDLQTAEEGVCKNDDNSTEHLYSPSEKEKEDKVQGETENVKNNKATKSKTKKDIGLSNSVKQGTETKTVNKKGRPSSRSCDFEAQKENIQIPVENKNKQKQALKSEKITPKSTKVNSEEPKWFILSGHKLQRREFQQMIRPLKGKICRVSHQWSYQATHFIVPDPIRRTEKFFAAAASGSWILKTDYLSASNEAGRFLTEEPYEWHKNGLSEDGQINLEAPRKWRLLKEKTGHGAFYGMRIVIYGECIAPTLDTLKRAVKAGDGTIVATSPPYTRFLDTGIDYAIVSPGMPHVDIWVQEFIKHEIPCVSADYLVEYVCKPGYPLESHVQYDTNVWAERSFNNLKNRCLTIEEEEEESMGPTTPESSDVACEVCGSRDRGEEMLMCGNESGSIGCGVGMHIDCCDPPFEDVPEEDWFCPNCSNPKITVTNNSKKSTSKRKAK
ncbi:BRCT domain-containing protein At4g02110 [Lactuca sativa]|uniref:BRCT domain-containing protein n=1 Tax=Lactuca sativa TaxID=4236 RepID=A0A9R1X144_LACSA|nr:BRCT domain-containing protein At4g02110 [Lactuca sativa]KAJ0194374.1 hypothetical protein LSAT_V11C800454140 [Lactuca sativa]